MGIFKLFERKEKEKEENEESINSDSTLDEMIDEKLRIFEKLIKDDKGLKFKKRIKGGALSKNIGLYNYYNICY